MLVFSSYFRIVTSMDMHYPTVAMQSKMREGTHSQAVSWLVLAVIASENAEVSRDDW